MTDDRRQRTEVLSQLRCIFFNARRMTAHKHLPFVFCILSSDKTTSHSTRSLIKYVSQVAGCALCLLSSAFAAPPSSIQATYDIYKDFMRVENRESYTRTQDHYTLSSVWIPVGLLAKLKPEKILMNSSGLVNRQGLQPQQYRYRREHDENKNKLAEFDWDNRKITLIHQGQRNVLALPDDTQDRLSAMYQFMFLSLQGMHALDFPMTDGNKLDNYHYTITPDQTIKVPAGEFKVIYLDSQAKPGENRTEIWLSTQHYNLPCKIIITEANGDVFTQVLSKLDIRP